MCIRDSPTTVRYFCEIVHRRDTIYRVPTVACIGSVTADAAQNHGFNVSIVPDQFTMDGLITAIVEYYLS